VEEGGNSVAHEHILTKDIEGQVWVVVLERGEVHLYPFPGRTAHNGAEERQQFEIFVVSLPKDHAFHRYEYEGAEETFHRIVVPHNPLA
jgi:hypothetical protein